MKCTELDILIFDHVAGRLSDAEQASVEGHLLGCPACRKLEAEERAVAELLRTRLQFHAPSSELTERLVSLAAAAERPRRVGIPPWLAAAAVLAGAVAVLLAVGVGRGARDVSRAIVSEALNDHLRILYAERPVEIESGGIHQVKPWFTGRLDFAPVVAFDGDDEFLLRGGSVGYLIDRKAAVFVYALRLHVISVLVFRAEGLSWPDGQIPIGSRRATASTLRGFHVLVLRDGDLGYAVVSDVGAPDLVKLLRKVDGAS